MARKTLLSAAIPQPANQSQALEPVVEALASDNVASISLKRPNSNKGKYHLGGYYEQDAPEIEAFRVLSAKSRKSQQELLFEAVRDLVEKYDADAKFGLKRA